MEEAGTVLQVGEEGGRSGLEEDDMFELEVEDGSQEDHTQQSGQHSSSSAAGMKESESRENSGPCSGVSCVDLPVTRVRILHIRPSSQF